MLDDRLDPSPYIIALNTADASLQSTRPIAMLLCANPDVYRHAIFDPRR
jgi:hypothetical protein